MLPENETKRILIVDDHSVVRQGLRQLVEDEVKRVEFAEAENAGEAIRLFGEGGWDLVILDISLPGRSGLDVLKDMNEINPDTPTLVLSMHSEDRYGARVLKAGASGYVTKTSPPEELEKAILKTLKKGRYISPDLAELLAMNLNDQHPEAPHENLSDREYEVMCLIASGKTVSEIARQLSLSPKTISTYRARVLEKMRMDTNAELTAYAIQRGLAMNDFE